MRDLNIDYRFIRYNINALNLISLIFNNNIEYVKNKRIKIIKFILLKFEVLDVVDYILFIFRDDINSSNILS